MAFLRLERNSGVLNWRSLFMFYHKSYVPKFY